MPYLVAVNANRGIFSCICELAPSFIESASTKEDGDRCEDAPTADRLNNLNPKSAAAVELLDEVLQVR